MKESANLPNWNPVNHYSRLLPQFTQAGPVPGMDILSVKANYLPSSYPVPFLRVRATRAWPPYALKHPAGPVRKADWKAHNNAHVDALIPANEFGRNIYDEYNPGGPAKWAKWCWTRRCLCK